MLDIELISASLAFACLWFGARCWFQHQRQQMPSHGQLFLLSLLLLLVGVRMLFYSNAFTWTPS